MSRDATAAASRTSSVSDPGHHQLLQPLQRLAASAFLGSPLDDLRGVQTVADQLLGECPRQLCPPNVTTRLVPSPISCSCACAAITRSLAAGCATFELAHDHRGVRGDEEPVQVVDHHLVHACRVFEGNGGDETS